LYFTLLKKKILLSSDTFKGTTAGGLVQLSIEAALGVPRLGFATFSPPLRCGENVAYAGNDEQNRLMNAGE